MHGKENPMPVKILFPLSLILLILSVSFAQKVQFEPKEVAQLSGGTKHLIQCQEGAIRLLLKVRTTKVN